MIVEKISELQMQIADLKDELTLHEAIYNDYVVKRVPVCNIRTDAVYEFFCDRHPDIVISQQRFTRILCKELGLRSTQSRLGGVRGSFYER